MKRMAIVIGAFVVASAVFAQVGSGVVAQSAAINPVGSYAVATVDEEGAPLSGTFVVRASGAGFSGEFVSGTGDTIPVMQVTTNQLGPGINTKATKKTTEDR